MIKMLSGPKEHKNIQDPTNHGFWNPAPPGPQDQNLGSLCLCGLWGLLRWQVKSEQKGAKVRVWHFIKTRSLSSGTPPHISQVTDVVLGMCAHACVCVCIYIYMYVILCICRDLYCCIHIVTFSLYLFAYSFASASVSVR